MNSWTGSPGPDRASRPRANGDGNGREARAVSEQALGGVGLTYFLKT